MVECGPIQAEQLAGSLRFDGSSSWRIVHQRQFAEELSGVIGFEVGLLAGEDLEAVEISMVDDVEGISNLALDYDVLAGLGVDFLHCINDDVELFFVEVAEEDAFFNE